MKSNKSLFFWDTKYFNGVGGCEGSCVAASRSDKLCHNKTSSPLIICRRTSLKHKPQNMIHFYDLNTSCLLLIFQARSFTMPFIGRWDNSQHGNIGQGKAILEFYHLTAEWWFHGDYRLLSDPWAGTTRVRLWFRFLGQSLFGVET